MALIFSVKEEGTYHFLGETQGVECLGGAEKFEMAVEKTEIYWKHMAEFYSGFSIYN